MEPVAPQFPLLDALRVDTEMIDTDAVMLQWKFKGEGYYAVQSRKGRSLIETISDLLTELKNWYRIKTRGVYASELHGVKL